MRESVWNEDDIAFLTEKYSSMKTSDIVKELDNRYSETQIRNKAKKLGLKKNKDGLAIHLWSEYEDKFLIENYTEMLINEIAIKLGLDETQVRNRANRLGLKKTNTWSKEDEKYLIDNYNSFTTEELIKNKLHKFTPKQIISKAHKLGLSKEVVYWTEKEIEILKLHYATKTNKYIRENFLPNRSVEQIKSKAKHLGLKKHDVIKYKSILDANKAKEDNWTEEEKSLLIEHYGEMNNKHLQRDCLPNRTLDAIRRKARELSVQNKTRMYFQWEQTDIEVATDNFNSITFSFKKVKVE